MNACMRNVDINHTGPRDEGNGSMNTANGNGMQNYERGRMSEERG